MALSRTEQPTRKRLEDARKRGQATHSREVDTAVVLLASFLALRYGGARAWDRMLGIMRNSLTMLDTDPLSIELTASIGTELIWDATLVILPLLLTIMGLSLFSGFMQTGGVMAVQALKPKASRLNPLQGAKRIFASKQSLVALAKSVLKFTVIVGITLSSLDAHRDEITGLGLTRELMPSLSIIVDIAFEIVLRVTIALLVMATADYLFQRSQLKSQLMMTRQEVRDEAKQAEGDPAVRGRMAAVRRSFLSRIMQSVPQADVVVTNPTHYAVALKYDPASDQAPRVIAKGERLVALRIREIAVEFGIPIVENPPLARAIFRAVPVNQEVTSELYEAVAEVLAFVYRLRYPQPRVAA